MCIVLLKVGVAFLAGLGFAIILIPINRWLANKIGQLSKAMMEQKDGRVKVIKSQASTRYHILTAVTTSFSVCIYV